MPVHADREKDSGKSTERSEEHGSIADELDDVEKSFHWYSEAAQRYLGRLMTDMLEKDPVPWNERAADALLETSLTLAAAASGQLLAVKAGTALFNKIKPSIELQLDDDELKAGHLNITETLSGMFKQGLSLALDGGKAAMKSETSEQPVRRFIFGQQQGVSAGARASQQVFLRRTRHQVTTQAEANALSNACSQPNIEEAAFKQYETSRDSWLGYLAQNKYGSFRRGPNAPTTTNMTDSAVREQVNEGTPGVVPSAAPNANDAVTGDAPGVLTLIADLPGARDSDEVPRVKLAMLNGVNTKIRSQYERKFAAEAKIPRVVKARVHGAIFPAFEVNVDESGMLCATTDAEWLRAHYEAAHPRTPASEGAKTQKGLTLLLQELFVNDIEGKIL